MAHSGDRYVPSDADQSPTGGLSSQYHETSSLIVPAQHYEEGLEVSNRPVHHEGDKYVAFHEGKHHVTRPDDSHEYKIPLAHTIIRTGDSSIDEKSHIEKPKFWRLKRWWFVGAVLLILVVVAIAVPVALTQRSTTFEPSGGGSEVSDTPDSASDPNVDQDFNVPIPQTNGSPNDIIRGTRLAQVYTHTVESRFLVFQDATGRLRIIHEGGVGDDSTNSIPEYEWQAITDRELPATDVMPGTPLAGASNSLDNGTMIWYIFYVDNQNIVQSIQRDTETEQWRSGDAGDLQFEVLPHPNIAFFLGWGSSQNDTRNDVAGGLTLFATGSDGLVHESLYNSTSREWRDGQIFAAEEVDGLGGGYFGYAEDYNEGFVVLNGGGNQMRLFVKEFSNTTDNPWEPGSATGFNTVAMENSAACLQARTMAYQDPSGRIMIANFTSDVAASDFTWSQGYLATDIIDPETRPMNGTGIGCWFYRDYGSRGNFFSIQYQTENGSLYQAAIPWYEDAADYSRWNHEPVYLTSA